jgi:hypothetical protein
MNFHYTYALLALIMCGLAGVAVLVRRDLWPLVRWAGLAGGVLESVSEIWYFQDYWRPPTLLSLPTPEDCCYGFGVTVLSVCVAPILLRKRYVQGTVRSRRWPATVILLLIFCLFMQAGTASKAQQHLPSIWMAIVIFALAGVMVCILRPDLIVPALLTAVVMGAVAAVGYAVGLDVVINGKIYLQQVYLLQNTRWDIRVLGNVPLDEIVWNTMRAFCMAALFSALNGYKLAPR